MIIPVSKLESIVFSKAFLSSVELNLRNEMNIDKVIDFTAMNVLPNHLIMSTVLLFIYGQLTYFQGQNTAYLKNPNMYDKLPKYQIFREKVRFLITIFLILFVKDIQSVN